MSTGGGDALVTANKELIERIHAADAAKLERLYALDKRVASEITNHKNKHNRPPRYTTNMQATKDVIDEMLYLGFHVRIMDGNARGDLIWHVWFTKIAANGEMMEFRSPYLLIRLEEAICLAALDAIAWYRKVGDT